MTSIVDAFNSAMEWVFDWVLWPFSLVSPEWGLVGVSVLSGLVLLWFYGKLSDQQGLRDTKRNIGANMLEAVLYRQDIRTSLRAQGRMFLYAFVYLRHAVVPILVLMIPCLVILAQLNERYNSSPLPVGEEMLIKARIDETVDFQKVQLAAPAGVELSPPLRIPADGEAIWRLKAAEAGPQELKLQIGEQQSAVKTLWIEDRQAVLAAGSYRSRLWGLLFPGDDLLPAGQPLRELVFYYPEARYTVLGMRMHWLVVFLVFSILAGLVGSKLLGVEI